MHLTEGDALPGQLAADRAEMFDHELDFLDRAGLAGGRLSPITAEQAGPGVCCTTRMIWWA